MVTTQEDIIFFIPAKPATEPAFMIGKTPGGVKSLTMSEENCWSIIHGQAAASRSDRIRMHFSPRGVAMSVPVDCISAL